MNEQELKSQIKSGDFSRVYLIFGEDNYLKNHYAKLIAEKSASFLPDMNLKKIDGKKADLQVIFDETEQLPCMADLRCVLLNDYDFAKLSANDQKLFIKIVEELPESTVLVILCDTIEIDAKKPMKWSSLIKAVEKKGAVLNFEHYSVSQLQNIMIKAASKRETMLDLSTAKYMIETVGRDLAKLQGEIDKLCAYCTGGSITKEIVEKMCAKSLDANKYQLVNLIFACNLSQALKMINTLFDMQLKEIEINTLIIGGFCDVYKAKMMVSAGVTSAKAALELDYKNREFALKNSAKTANSISTDKLRECLDILNTTDIKLKSTSEDKRFLLEQTVINLVRTLRRKV